jgi:polyhydroxyalkanoate synthesis regulator phasin
MSALNQLWLASLGALATLGTEGRKLVHRLAERGSPLSERQRARVGEVRRRATKLAAGTRDLARETLQYETHRAVKRLGVMTAEDLNVFTARLETLAKKIDDMAAAPASSTETQGEEAGAAMAPPPAVQGRGRQKAAAARPLN